MSESPAAVDLVFLWHHHQPDYRQPGDGRALLPWVRLHATKDYLDMAVHLERHPGVRATFNFVPVLLDQLDQAAAGAPDALFDLLARPVAALTPEERLEVARRCTAAPRYARERWAEYRRLLERASRSPHELSDADLLALETWFLLGWVDPLFHEQPEAARALALTGSFGVEHRDGLLALHARLLAAVIPAYRALAERGQIELSASPYHHPILPLLIDLRVARRARPDLSLPAEPFAAPEDAREHIARARSRHASAFGEAPAGVWPSEGSVSPETVELAAAAGVRWMASDEGVLWASLSESDRRPGALYRPWTVETGAGEIALFFRDHELSDRIGFVYQRWQAADAVGDFLARLRKIGREHGAAGPPVVSVILDGENCWEGYADDGFAFLDTLYRELEAAPDIRTRTPREVLDGEGPRGRLSHLHSGSWIDADFHIWVGHPEKNRAWDLLARARRALVEQGSTRERHPRAWESLARAEGSDWFWWFGDDHYSADREIFDRLFRTHVSTAYAEAGLVAPASLAVPVSRPRARAGAHQRPLGFVRPTLDGRRTHYYEWHAAGRVALTAGGGSMHRRGGRVSELYYGFDRERLLLRLDFEEGLPGGEIALAIEVAEPRPLELVVERLEPGRHPVLRRENGRTAPLVDAACSIGDVLELGVTFASLGWSVGQTVELLLQLRRDGQPIENLPPDEVVGFTVPDASFEATMWSA
jgi:alpha-amylase/alpha-mannosidase (GH57 family)